MLGGLNNKGRRENHGGSTLLKLTMENVMTQWIKESTRFRREEEPLRLDLIFTKEQDVVEDIICKSPNVMSDRVITELQLSRREQEDRKEEHRAERNDYRRTTLMN